MEPIIYKVDTDEDAQDLINNLHTELEFHEESYKGVKYIIENNIKEDFPRFSIETCTGQTYLITIQKDFLVEVLDNYLEYVISNELYEKAKEIDEFKKIAEDFINEK